jgi:hypothetical protein
VTKAFKTKANSTFEISVVRNPFNKNLLSISLQSSIIENFSVKIHDVVSKLVYAEILALRNEELITLDISEYSLGMYYLSVENSFGETHLEKFIVR